MLRNKHDKYDKELQTINRNGLTWTDIVNPDRKKINHLAEKYPNFRRLNLSDCLTGVQHQK
jgi:hypothetical protein